MSIEDDFKDLGVDAITGTELMELLSLTPDDFMSPQRFEKFKNVIKYIQNVPDKEYFLKKITMKGLGDDKLQKVWEYCELAKKKEEIEKMKSDLDAEKNVVLRFASEKNTRPEDMEAYKEKMFELNNVSSKLRQVEEEMRLYEK